VQSFTARRPLLMATSALEIRKKMLEFSLSVQPILSPYL